MDNDMNRAEGSNKFANVESHGGEQGPTGEDQGVNAVFSASDVAKAFDVEIDRVHNALAGEYNLGTDAKVDSRQAQLLAEVILGDRPQAEQEAALMQLGAFTPRRDTLEASVSEKPPGELSDRLRPTEEAPEFGPPDVPVE
jgi:hypothetical protein